MSGQAIRLDDDKQSLVIRLGKNEQKLMRDLSVGAGNASASDVLTGMFVLAAANAYGKPAKKVWDDYRVEVEENK